MNFKALIVAGAIALSAALAPASALAVELLANGSFESGLDGWTASNEDFVQTTPNTPHFDADNIRTDYYAADYLAMGVLPPADPQLLFAVLSGDQPGAPITLRQSFTLGPRGGTLSGWAAFLGGDYQPFGDFGYVRLLDGDDNLLDSLFDGSIGADPGYNATAWTFFTRDLLAGAYTIEAGIVNVGDAEQASKLIVDRFSVTVVPEPMTWALMLTGFFGMGAMLRRQRRPQPVRIRRD